MAAADQPLTCFAEHLFEGGEVLVTRTLEPFSAADLAAFDVVTAAFHAEDTLRMPGTAPAFDAVACRWAGERFYRACQCLHRRDIEADDVRSHLLPPFPGEISPSVVYSADLFFRFLCDLVSLAKGLAPGDVLVECLRELAASWPFSSVGMDALPALSNLEMISEDRSLRLAYVDRLIEQRDTDRLQPEWVREQIREALGNHPYLWPDFDDFIQPINRPGLA